MRHSRVKQHAPQALTTYSAQGRARTQGMQARHTCMRQQHTILQSSQPNKSPHTPFAKSAKLGSARKKYKATQQALQQQVLTSAG